MIAGGGPEWLFNIDALLESMNYAPVPTERHNAKSSTKTVNTVRPINTTIPTCADYPSDPLMPDLEDTGIFDDAYNDRDDGAEADYNNLETVTHALDDESWVEAMPEELLQFKLLNVWTLVDLPHGKRSIRTKWVYRNKRDQRGIVFRNKARLVAQGHRKEEGIDYDEVFAHVARIEAIRLFLAYASYMDFTVYQIDVKSAFFYGTIEEEVYVIQPLGFVDPEFPNKVRGTIDKTLFIKKINNDILLIQVYVDDIIFSSTKKSLSTEFEQLMNKRFQMSSIGELTFFLGLQVEQQKDGIFLSQDKYVCDIIKKFGFSSVKSASTPMETHKPVSKDANGTDVDVYLYRYLKGQPTLGLWYPKDSPLELIAYSDSDYAGSSLDRKSTKEVVRLELKRYLINDGYADLVQHLKDLPETFNDTYVTPCHTKKVLSNMARKSVNFSRKVTPLFDSMLVQHKAPEGEGIDRGGSPRCQETMRGTSAQTRSERVLEQPNEPPLTEGHTSKSEEGRMEYSIELINNIPPTPQDSPLTRGYTPRSDEGRVKLEELMNLCKILSNMVTTLENELSSTKAVYHKAFITLTKRVKKLETQLKQKRSRVVIHSSDEEEPTELSKDDNDATLAETLLNIKRSTTKDKRKGIIQETELPKKIKKREMIQLSLDEELAQKLYAKELLKETARQEQEKYNLKKALELQRKLDKREEDVDKCDQNKEIDWNDLTVLRYHALQNRPFSKAEVRKNMCMYLKNQGVYKQIYFKGMKYKDIRPIFERVWDQVHTFVPKDSKIKKEVMKCKY
uniref:Reverse transcriptase Ty1/copia-type domain-containing protein n=1 Tax=Tanacetum cinerariifolium TaxID=118510 RepID=A0A6L2M585_TANCI|nr:hypothetical protein [Tanacetum cinerariifolium]